MLNLLFRYSNQSNELAHDNHMEENLIDLFIKSIEVLKKGNQLSDFGLIEEIFNLNKNNL